MAHGTIFASHTSRPLQRVCGAGNFGSLQVTVQAFTSCADAGSECMCSTEFDNMANAIDTCGMAVPRVYRETMAACHCE